MERTLRYFVEQWFCFGKLLPSMEHCLEFGNVYRNVRVGAGEDVLCFGFLHTNRRRMRRRRNRAIRRTNDASEFCIRECLHSCVDDGELHFPIGDRIELNGNDIMRLYEVTDSRVKIFCQNPFTPGFRRVCVCFVPGKRWFISYIQGIHVRVGVCQRDSFYVCLQISVICWGY